MFSEVTRVAEALKTSMQDTIISTMYTPQMYLSGLETPGPDACRFFPGAFPEPSAVVATGSPSTVSFIRIFSAVVTLPIYEV